MEERTYTFFGHQDCPDFIRPKLWETLVELNEQQNVTMFYVRRQGRFDVMVRQVLRELKEVYPHIDYAVVLERMPGKRSMIENEAETLLTEVNDTVNPRFALSWRNNWMLKRSDVVVAYVTHSWGGAQKFAEKAAKGKKAVINTEKCV